MKTTGIYLEHANLNVSDVEKSIHFFTTAFPHFKIRGGGGEGNDKWLHLGDDLTYLAINQGIKSSKDEQHNYDVNGINHIGFVVNDVEEIAERLSDAGFKRSYPKQVQQFRIRDYFDDADGNQYEFVQYLSDKMEEKNSYAD